jgi:hypothetical protein
MRLRIVAAFAIGAFVIGFLAWPIVAQPTPFDSVSFTGGTVSAGDIVTLVVLAFLASLIAYFVCWPWGREIGVIAAPAGLAIWAIRSGNMASLITENPSVEQQRLLLDGLRFEPLAWLVVVAAGFAGVGLCELFMKRQAKSDAEAEPKGKVVQPGPEERLFGTILETIGFFTDRIKQRQQGDEGQSGKAKGPQLFNAVLGVLLSVVIAQFCIGIFAQDRSAIDREMGLVAAQPAIGQIVFGVWFSFGIAAFVVKKFLGAGYIWPTLASGIVTAFGIMVYMKADTLAYLVEHWPAVFYSNAVISILPIQMVAFGTLGSIWGYWLAVRFAYWREHGQSE